MVGAVRVVVGFGRCECGRDVRACARRSAERLQPDAIATHSTAMTNPLVRIGQHYVGVDACHTRRVRTGALPPPLRSCWNGERIASFATVSREAGSPVWDCGVPSPFATSGAKTGSSSSATEHRSTASADNEVRRRARTRQVGLDPCSVRLARSAVVDASRTRSCGDVPASRVTSRTNESCRGLDVLDRRGHRPVEYRRRPAADHRPSIERLQTWDAIGGLAFTAPAKV